MKLKPGLGTFTPSDLFYSSQGPYDKW